MRFYSGYLKNIRWLLLSLCLFHPVLVLAETVAATEAGKTTDVPAVETTTAKAPEAATAAEPETQAKEDEAVKAEPEDDTMTISGKKYQWIETSRRYVGNAVQRATGSVDSYLSKDHRESANATFIRLRLGYVLEEGGGSYPNNDIRIKVYLPKTQNRWSLFFETDPSEFKTLEEQQQDNKTRERAFTNTDGSIGAVKFLLNDWRYWKNDFDVGIKTPFPLNPFVRFNLRRHYQISPVWSSSLKNSVYYFNLEGFGEHSVFTLERRLGTSWLFANYINMQWKEVHDTLEFSEVISFQNRLTERDLFLYRTGIFYQEHPVPHMQSYFVDTVYRRRLHKDWLFSEVIPSVTWSEARDFNAFAALTFRLEVIFN